MSPGALPDVTRRRGPGQRAFSTSASLLIVFVGLFIALGSLYTVTANTTERLADAQTDARERQEAVTSTRVAVTDATWDTDADSLVVAVQNTGETTLSVRATDTVVDGTYVPISAYETVTVDGQTSDVWRPGERLVIEDTDPLSRLDGVPDRVRFVTEHGVAGVGEVSER